MTTFCLFLWPIALVVNFLTSKPDNPSPWARLIDWMSPKEDTDA